MLVLVRPVPEFDELVTLIQACLGNAGELLADTRILLAAERVPQAHALATLALEEIGKACICILAVAPMPTPEHFSARAARTTSGWRGTAI
jgi:AbiV family abortive infection protein